MDERNLHYRSEALLADRLLRCGVGLKHVRRTLRELRDHRMDLVQRLMAHGHDRCAAELEAGRVLGDQEEFVMQMIARPELRSRARRLAWLLFAIAPMPMVVAICMVVMLTAERVLVAAGVDLSKHVPGSTELMATQVLLQWVAPLVVGGLLLQAAVRRRVPAIWPVCAAALIALASGGTSFYVARSPSGEEYAVFGFWPYPFDEVRAVLFFAVLCVTYLLWRRGTSPFAGESRCSTP